MSWFRNRRRKKARQRPFPAEWLEILAGNVPYYARLTPDEQRQLQGLIQSFLEEKAFEGAADFAITDEVRVTIAAQASLLLLGRDDEIFPTLRTIIVYPLAYVSEEKVHAPEGTQIDQTEVRAGESWGHGTLLLSWDDVLFGASDPDDGENLVLHELAHQLDEETGEANGLPYLPEPEMYADWEEVFSAAFERLSGALDRGLSPEPLEPYAAESPAEFFAVCTELFFERPGALREHDPALYEQLKRFYDQDPVARSR